MSNVDDDGVVWLLRGLADQRVPEDLHRWVDTLAAVNMDGLVEVLGSDGPAALLAGLCDVAGGNDAVADLIRQVLGQSPRYAFSWLLDEPKAAVWTLFAARYPDPDDDEPLTILARTVASGDPMIPADLRGAAAVELLSRLAQGATPPTSVAVVLMDSLDRAAPARTRSLHDKMLAGSNSIDHCFPIPEDLATVFRILEDAGRCRAAQLAVIDVDRLFTRLANHDAAKSRLVEAWNAHPHREAILRAHRQIAETVPKPDQPVYEGIEADLDDGWRHWTDYALCWDELVAVADGYHYSTAELLRMVLLTGRFQTPDDQAQAVRLAFYRGVLRISSAAVIGLTAGPFHVEHGNRTTTSLFYLGSGATLGKSCMIDTTGPVIIHRKAFLGGGFMPILVHTHTHRPSPAAAGTAERRHIDVAAFVAAPGARLPMQTPGMLEVADWTGDGPYPGLSGHAVY